MKKEKSADCFYLPEKSVCYRGFHTLTKNIPKSQNFSQPIKPKGDSMCKVHAEFSILHLCNPLLHNHLKMLLRNINSQFLRITDCCRRLHGLLMIVVKEMQYLSGNTEGPEPLLDHRKCFVLVCKQLQGCISNLVCRSGKHPTS